jgi:hypothetical protein
MFGSWVLEVAIGLIFVFLLFSTICAALREGIEAWTKTRAAYLERGLRELLHDKAGDGLAKEFYEHPLIYSLYAAGKYVPGTDGARVRACPSGGELPSYIPSKNFAAAMIDLAARGPLPSLTTGPQAADPALSMSPISAQSLRAGIATMENKRVARALLNALDLAQDDLNKTRLNLEAWYDAGMDRVSGWYKRSTQWIVFWLALVMAVVLNVDTIGIANFLYQNDTARHAVVQEAEATNAAAQARNLAPAPVAQTRAQTQPADAAPTPTATSGAAAQTEAPGTVPVLTTKQKYDMAKAKLNALNLPIGWESGGFTCNPSESMAHCSGVRAVTALGWIVTALAATLGAPFWFDTLNKVMVIRSTVKPYEKSKPEGSEDRQNAESLALVPALRQLAGPTLLAGAAATAGAAAAAPDNDADVDGCTAWHGTLTRDDELPATDGGVLR